MPFDFVGRIHSFLFTNITIVLVFSVHEKIIKTLKKNAELQLAKQKEKINEEYYSILQKQQDSSNILIHDIKKHLQTIRELSAESNNDNVVKYVDSVYSSNRIKMLKQHSNNKLVNVIVSKYAEICEEDGINFSIDIRNIDFTFIADNDLTAILDNLLENAYEASNASQMKLINMVIEKRNENYVMISVSNSADKKPVYDNGNFITSKKNTHLHGIGLKSVKQIASKYNGDVHLDYDDAAHKFHAVILLKMS